MEHNHAQIIQHDSSAIIGTDVATWQLIPSLLRIFVTQGFKLCRSSLPLFLPLYSGLSRADVIFVTG